MELGDGRTPALIEGERVLDFAELSSRVAAAAGRYGGWPAGARVAFCPERSVDGLIELAGVLSAGLVPCLLHPRWPAELGVEAAARVGADPLAVRPGPPRPPRAPEDDWVVLFTSGSSGAPKGVRLSARAVSASAAAFSLVRPWRPEDRWLLDLPIAHVGGFSVLTRCWGANRAVVLPDRPCPPRFDPEHFVQTVARRSVTIASLVPTMLGRVVALGLRAPPSVSLVLVGGAAAPPALLSSATELGWPLMPTYGLTEASSMVTLGAPGQPLPGTEVRIERGVIELRGPTLLSGYLPDRPALDEQGWFRTGDLGALDEAGLRVLGRADSVIVTGGENVSPERVEAALRACPGVEDAVVYGLADPEWGQIVAATVVGEAPAHVPGLARFEQPRRIRTARALPLLPSGKVDRRAAQRASAAESSVDLD